MPHTASEGGVVRWLKEAGLPHHSGGLGRLDVAEFRNLQMQDYSKFGVTKAEDKQRLFRAIKALNQEWKAGPSVDQWQMPGSTDDDSWQKGQVSATEEHAALGNDSPKRIRVVVRKRPLNAKEIENGEEDTLDVSMDLASVVVNEPRLKVDLTKFVERHTFSFDDCLSETVTNDEVYKITVQPLVATIFRQGKATCFAYGQTGSGKTYTMQPLPLRAAADIFTLLAEPQYKSMQLWISCFEIYSGKLYDLLNGRKRLEAREDGKRTVQIVGLKELLTENVSSIKNLLDLSSSSRSTGCTGANADSSRSHCILQFTLKRTAGMVRKEADEGLTVGKISFIDLAGSERGADTSDSNRQTRMEGAEINKSLLALKECIRALDSMARHVPFRGSKLTEVLRDSFTGEEARTVMIANVSPNSASCEHTLNTLRYADRVKELKKGRNTREVTPQSDINSAKCLLPPLGEKQLPSAVRQESLPTMTALEAVPSQLSSHLVMQRPSTPLKARPSPNIAATRAARQSEDMDPAQGHAAGSERHAPDASEMAFDAENEMIAQHRRHIEGTMRLVRHEMGLLGKVDQNGVAASYVERLHCILDEKDAMTRTLRQYLNAYQRSTMG